MIEFSDTITLNELLDKYSQDETILNGLPEFSPFVSLAQGIKERRCRCGKYQEIERAQIFFNHIVSTLPKENVDKMKAIFKKEKLCFGIQTREKFELKCY